jgi:hypothetical protein
VSSILIVTADSYGPNGNRQQAGYIPLRQSHSRLYADGTYEYRSDNNGSLTKRTNISTQQVTLYTWDHRNRLTDLTDQAADGTVTQHVHCSYNAADQRIAKQIDSNADGTYEQTPAHRRSVRSNKP